MTGSNRPALARRVLYFCTFDRGEGDEGVEVIDSVDGICDCFC